MINILLLSHGRLAEEFLNTAVLIIGMQQGICALGLGASEGMEDFKNRILNEYSKLSSSDEILVLTDLYGGTPTNAAIYGLLNKNNRVEIMTGLNLPILLEAIIKRNLPMAELLEGLKKTGAEGIINIREVIRQ